jgi:hypothetical protein
MRQIQLLMLVSILAIQPVFAEDATSSDNDSKPCAAIAKACLKSGYSFHGSDHKKFWQDCMKPIILGQTVKGVNIDSATVKSCRIDKINRMKKDLTEFEKVSS